MSPMEIMLVGHCQLLRNYLIKDSLRLSCHTLIICVELLLQLFHLLVISEQSLVSLQSACCLLLLFLTNISYQ